MKKVLIVYRVDRSDPSNIGVIQKLIGQKNGLISLGLEVDYIIHDRDQIYLNERQIVKIEMSSYRSRLSYYDYLPLELVSGYDIYFFRYGLATPSFLRCVKRVRQSTHHSKILIDMPTYPYAGEWSGLKGGMALMMDSIYSRSLHRYVNYVVHSGQHASLFDIPTINMPNGVDLDLNPLRDIQSAGDQIRMLAMAKWRQWHGLDRLLHTIDLYRKDQGLSTPLSLSILGEGPALASLRDMVDQLGLEEIVSFEGILTGKALDEAFNHADLGIGTLGLHRKKVMIDSSLKHRVYIARGLPMIYGAHDSDIDSALPFVYCLSSPDESIIDLPKIINFAKAMKQNDLRADMRLFAEERLDWKAKMGKLVAYLEEC
jgi:hypothetical protein